MATRPDTLIQLSTLGTLDLRDQDGHRVRSVLNQPRRVALLVYLASAPDVAVPRDTLIGLFWPECSESRARQNLYQAVHYLRDRLGSETVEGGEAGYRICTRRLHCDAVRFAEARERDDHASALDQYKGDFLAGFSVDSAPGFQRWMEQRRQELSRDAVESALELARSTLSADPAVSSSAARRALELTDLDEPAIRSGIELLWKAGDRLGALGGYRDLVDRLHEEFATGPSPETMELGRALQEDMSRGDQSATVAPVTGGFPAEPTITPRMGNESTRGLGRQHVAALAAAAIVVSAAAGALWHGVGGRAGPMRSGGLRILVEEVTDYGAPQARSGLSAAVTTETLAAMSEIPSVSVAPWGLERGGTEVSPAHLMLRSSLVTMGDSVRVTAVLLDATSGAVMARGRTVRWAGAASGTSHELAQWLADFVRYRASDWTRAQQPDGLAVNGRAVELVRSAVIDRARADTLRRIGSVKEAAAYLAIADSLLARAEREAQQWTEPRIQRAEIALDVMWLTLIHHSDQRATPREAVTVGLDHAANALRIDPDDPGAADIAAALEYWYWVTLDPRDDHDASRRTAELEHALRTVVDSDPTRARAWTNLSALLQARGDFAAARWAAERARRADLLLVHETDVLARLFETSLETGDHAAAGRWCEHLGRALPGSSVHAYCEMSLLAWDPDPTPAHVHHAWSVLEQVRPSVVPGSPWRPRLEAAMAVVLARAALPDSAENVLARAIRSGGDPDLPPFHAWALVHLGQGDSARAVLERYVSERPAHRAGILKSRRFRRLWPDPPTLDEAWLLEEP